MPDESKKDTSIFAAKPKEEPPFDVLAASDAMIAGVNKAILAAPVPHQPAMRRDLADWTQGRRPDVMSPSEDKTPEKK